MARYETVYGSDGSYKGFFKFALVPSTITYEAFWYDTNSGTMTELGTIFPAHHKNGTYVAKRRGWELLGGGYVFKSLRAAAEALRLRLAGDVAMGATPVVSRLGRCLMCHDVATGKGSHPEHCFRCAANLASGGLSEEMLRTSIALGPGADWFDRTIAELIAAREFLYGPMPADFFPEEEDDWDDRDWEGEWLSQREAHNDMQYAEVDMDFWHAQHDDDPNPYHGNYSED